MVHGLARQQYSLVVAVLVVLIGKIVRRANAASSTGAQVLERNLGLGSHSLPSSVACESAGNLCMCVQQHQHVT